MKSVRFLNRQIGSGLSAFALLLALVLPGLVPALVSADTVTNRSIQLSTSTVNADNVTYNVKFTISSAGAGAFIVDFCSNSPIIGTSCTAPTGFSTASVDTTTGSTTADPAVSNRAVKVVKTMAGSENVDVVLTGINNPSVITDDTTGFYARILTYADSTAADGYTSATSIGSPVDEGGVALSITNEIGVTAAVREALTFCVANQTITEDCGDAGDVGHEPNLELGETSGGTKALSTSTVSTGSIFTQLSTNAESGAVVRLKSNATGCGGLKLAGGSGCIAPAVASAIGAGTAAFGVRTSTPFATSGAADPTGTLQEYGSSGYNTTTYNLNYASNNSTGVTSAYGDPIIDTNDAPTNNQNMEFIFGARINNNTPAGLYSANLSMIAAGTY